MTCSQGMLGPSSAKEASKASTSSARVRAIPHRTGDHPAGETATPYPRHRRRAPVDLDACRPEPLPITVADVRELHNALVAAFEETAVRVPALNFDPVRSALTGVGWDEARTGRRRALGFQDRTGVGPTMIGSCSSSLPRGLPPTVSAPRTSSGRTPRRPGAAIVLVVMPPVPGTHAASTRDRGSFAARPRCSASGVRRARAQSDEAGPGQNGTRPRRRASSWSGWGRARTSTMNPSISTNHA